MGFARALLTTCMMGALLAGCGAPQESSTKAADAVSEVTRPQAVQLPALTGSESFRVMISGTDLGGMTVEHGADKTVIDYEYRNNGRGPTIKEEITLGPDGIPRAWQIDGAATFGNEIAERFTLDGNAASWTDATGTGTATVDTPTMYVAQDSSPYALWLYARVLLADADNKVAVLPGGELRLDKMEDLKLKGPDGEVDATSYAVSGISMNPTYMLADPAGVFYGFVTPRFAFLREGFEGDHERLRERAVKYSTERFETIQAEVAHTYEGPVRISNVRVFDPKSQALSAPASVVFEGNKISAVEAANANADGETVIDGQGGTLVAGMYEMHGHMGQNSALLNIAAGITSVRDMGNQNDVLGELIEKIQDGRLAGPRIIRSGFIEGKSPYSSNNGELVTNQEEAIAAVRKYGNGDFHQIKIYNSMKGEWVPAMIKEARKLGLRVAGHVPAFSNADQMIEAGYDEMTHINQVMLGWVLDEGEDTRTLLRLTALKRLPDLDINDAKVQKTIKAMAERGTAIDPTLAIHEALLRSRNGVTQEGVLDYIDNMPISSQRSAKTAWADISAPGDDEAYRVAFDKVIETVSAMHEAGIMLVPGTDLGGGLTYHRELELYQKIGMSAPEILAWATLGMADYVGQADELGSIEPGKLADFFLVPGDPTKDLKAIKSISMVVKDGQVYFPSEIYPEFGVKPFADAPPVRE